MFWTKETYRIHGFDPGEFAPRSDEHINRTQAEPVMENGKVVRVAGIITKINGNHNYGRSQIKSEE